MSVPAKIRWRQWLAAAVIASASLGALSIASAPAEARVFVGVGIAAPYWGYPAPVPYYGYYRPYYPHYWYPWHRAVYPGWRWRHWHHWHPYHHHW